MEAKIRGLFVVIEGIDGSGKTTLAENLAGWARANYPGEVLHTREPGGTPVGKEIRSLLAAHRGLSPETVALLMIADRLEHLRQQIEPALEENVLVICDRYTGSAWSYQVAQGVDPAWLNHLQIGLRIPPPDLVILLDLPSVLAIQRAKPPLGGIRADLEYMEAVRGNYLEQASQNGWLVLDATASQDDVFRAAKTIIESRLDM